MAPCICVRACLWATCPLAWLSASHAWPLRMHTRAHPRVPPPPLPLRLHRDPALQLRPVLQLEVAVVTARAMAHLVAAAVVDVDDEVTGIAARARRLFSKFKSTVAACVLCAALFPIPVLVFCLLIAQAWFLPTRLMLDGRSSALATVVI